MHSSSTDLNHLFPALDIIYDFVTRWQSSISGVACGRGCSTCCTDQVTLTELEAYRILTALQNHTDGQPHFSRPCASALITNNEFAHACLNHIDQKQPDFPNNPGPCPFLSSDSECTVYQARPLMCRLFISMSPCADTGEAALPEHIFLTQIILQQLTEHLAEGLRWGNLSIMLLSCKTLPSDSFQDLRRCRKIPGFPFSMEEKRQIERQLQPLFQELCGGGWLSEGFNLG